MLTLKNITKHYDVGDTRVEALRGVSLTLRNAEFVSVLGPSGCGKTTLLNIIGGLDRYTSGELYISGRPTGSFSDHDWDVYRNHSIGFVFQNYNLIPHQTVLANVELALTISGVDAKERRRRAAEALSRVGLTDQMSKKPNQMSGGQMQRVAIARALVNDPEILLADEPTGALDTATSVQVMEILKEISRDRLVIMVTHNSELAERYSTRIIRLLDGSVVGDSDPCDNEKTTLTEPTQKDKPKKEKHNGKDKASMSFVTALSLSFNNLLTKKARTFLVSFAGSIGIFGIALILALSTGINAYIARVQEDTLSAYPITIQAETIDLTSLMQSFAGQSSEGDLELRVDWKIYSNDMYGRMMNTLLSEIQSNDLAEFKSFLESEDNGLGEFVSAVKYTYDIDLPVYATNTADGVTQINPSPLISDMMSVMGGSMSSGFSSYASSMYRMNVFSEMLDDEELLHKQYECVAGRWPSNYDEVLLVIDKDNGISDLALYTLGLRDQKEATELFEKIMRGEPYEVKSTVYDYDDILGLTFKLLLRPDAFVYDDVSKTYVDVTDYGENPGNEPYLAEQINTRGIELKIVGIIRPGDDAVSTSIDGTIAYTGALTREYIKRVNNHELVVKQNTEKDTDVFTGIAFSDGKHNITIEAVNAYVATLPEEQRAQIEGYMAMMSEAQILEYFASYLPSTDATFDGNIERLGSVDLESPATISIYASTFGAKDEISSVIDNYNSSVIAEGHEEKVIKYTDYVKIIMSSITTIINVISGVLIAFVGISLFVSSIMIGVITYISVLERTKEIGILRAIGASKRDIARVFNAESAIIGFASGLLGIGVTLLLIIPTNIIIRHFSGIQNLSAVLPLSGGIWLVLVSVILTLVAGVIPSLIAAKKDPVEALRTE